ncbi:MAG TPA: FeoB-associated Cys-rich membrane protein [Clostridiales bacterium]|nr:FeoB-associated Cys-rich membrane protein [Clostridiales bacterium]
MEIIITIGIVALAAYIFYRSTKKRTKGECECGCCSSQCPVYEEHKKNS